MLVEHCVSIHVILSNYYSEPGTQLKANRLTLTRALPYCSAVPWGSLESQHLCLLCPLSPPYPRLRIYLAIPLSLSQVPQPFAARESEQDWLGGRVTRSPELGSSSQFDVCLTGFSKAGLDGCPSGRGRVWTKILGVSFPVHPLLENNDVLEGLYKLGVG